MKVQAGFPPTDVAGLFALRDGATSGELDELIDDIVPDLFCRLSDGTSDAGSDASRPAAGARR